MYRLINVEQKIRRSSQILFWRELLAYSVEGRRIDMVTITSKHGVDLNARRLEKITSAVDNIAIPRPYEMNKPVVFLTARSHAADVPASRVMDALLEFLTNEYDAQAM